jgi:adenylate cyclase
MKRLKAALSRISPVVTVGLTLTFLSVGLFVSFPRERQPRLIRDISRKAYDALLRAVHVPARSGAVAIVDLDDESLQAVGQWPWPRYIIARLIDRMFEAGAAVVGFDIVFAEKDRTSPVVLEADIREYLGQELDFSAIPPDLRDYDRLLAHTLERGNVVLGATLRPTPKRPETVDLRGDPMFRSHVLPKGVKGTTNEVCTMIKQADAITAALTNLTQFAESAFFNTDPDPDSIIRAQPLIWALGDRIYTALSVAALRTALGVRNVVVKYDEWGVESLALGDITIPVDAEGRLTLNYRTVREHPRSQGAEIAFPTCSAVEVLRGTGDLTVLSNRIVFVGTSAAGLRDIRATPLTQYCPGVELHATIVDNLLSGDALREPFEFFLLEILVTLFMGVFLTILIARGRSWLSFLVSLAMILCLVKASMVLMSRYQLVLVPAWTILSIMTIYPVLTMIRFWQEERQKRRVRDMFGTMVSRDVLSYLEDNPGSFSLTGEKREATMFFSDVAGFTTISESLEPSQLADLLNHYLSPMTDIIMQRRGYVDKYEGDAIMAVWGVPFPMPDHAVQACYAALEQQTKLAEIRQVLKDQFGHELFVRMGINSGHVTAGNMGSNRRFQYTVMGDAVNQAARFEPANKDYETLIMMGETTYREAKDSIEARLIDRIVVKGKTKPISIYELMAKKGELSDVRRQVREFYERGLQSHWDRKWEEAIACLDAALRLDSSDGPSGKMRERILHYVENPPPVDWQGEYVRRSKD